MRSPTETAHLVDSITAGASAGRRMRKCVSLFEMLPSMV